MNRLNYFNPYDSKSGSHEDQLTRAYLVLLKHSCHAFFTFIDYCRSKHKTSGKEKPFTLIDFLEQGWEIETQKGNPIINSNYLLSVLITDSNIAATNSDVRSSERNARYDGLITFGNNLTMVIENKPRSGSVWFEQLNPSRQNLAEATIVYSAPIILEWKEIIKHLNHLLSAPTISGYEKLMIEDFLSYVDENFPVLNPYDSFHQCKNNSELLRRRISNLLKSIVIDENLIRYHQGWGWVIQTPYKQIKEIGLILKQTEDDYSIEVSLYFGASQQQAIAFYDSNHDLSGFKDPKWKLFPSFHVSFMTSNLVWFKSDDRDSYLKFWKDNIDKIHQQKRADVRKYLKWLVDENVINMPKESEDELQDKFYKKAMQTLNMCPEFGVVFSISSSDARQLDKSGKLKFIVAEKIREGLKIVGLDGKEILKKL